MVGVGGGTSSLLIERHLLTQPWLDVICIKSSLQPSSGYIETLHIAGHIHPKMAHYPLIQPLTFEPIKHTRQPPLDRQRIPRKLKTKKFTYQAGNHCFESSVPVCVKVNLTCSLSPSKWITSRRNLQPPQKSIYTPRSKSLGQKIGFPETF
jgi:hypothetical protein